MSLRGMGPRKKSPPRLAEPENPDAAYCATCPYCKGDHTLEVVSGTFELMGATLGEDGFSFVDAQQVTTEDEQVKCSECGKQFPLSEVTR